MPARRNEDHRLGIGLGHSGAPGGFFNACCNGPGETRRLADDDLVACAGGKGHQDDGGTARPGVERFMMCLLWKSFKLQKAALAAT